jgi:hypothetical protein
VAKRGEKKRRKQARQRRRAQDRRRAGVYPSETTDPRAVSATVEAMDGVPVTEETQIVLIEPITLPSGEHLWFQSPHVQPFYLLEAKKMRDAAERKRLGAITKTIRTPDEVRRTWEDQQQLQKQAA